MNNNILQNMSYGVYITSTVDRGRPTGCVTNSIMQITASPATFAVSVNHDNYTNGCIADTGMFAFSILSERSDPSLIGRFGFQSGRDGNKFEGVDYDMKEGMPVLKDSCGYVVCRVIDRMETSTHTVFLGELVDCDVWEGAAEQMTYAYYHRVLKGSSPKNAPTYLPPKPEKAPAEKKGGKWVCQVCGYVYEGEELPADFKCPICGVGTDRFVKTEE